MKKEILKKILTFLIYCCPIGILVFLEDIGWLRVISNRKLTCMPENNIHIFDEGKEACRCWGSMRDGTKFSIPIVAQRKKK